MLNVWGRTCQKDEHDTHTFDMLEQARYQIYGTRCNETEDESLQFHCDKYHIRSSAEVSEVRGGCYVNVNCKE